MDIAAFKVSHSVGCDKNATALRAARARSVSIGAMDESSQGKFKRQTNSPIPLRTHKAAYSQFSRAMERYVRGSWVRFGAKLT